MSTDTIVYQEEWAARTQERLDKPTNWKEVLDVIYTDTRVFNNPYIADITVQTGGSRNSAFTVSDITETNEYLTISTYDYVAVTIDRADLAQSNFSKQMALADLMSTELVERIETAMLAKHADWANLGDDGSGNVTLASTTALTVTSTNIDDIIRAVIREVQKANGFSLAQRNGIFIIWRPQDWELLVQFMQANGFSMADQALRDGGEIGVKYMGVYHYVSNSHTSGHLFAGVRKAYTLGIVKSTWGDINIIQNPAGASGGNISGIGIELRADYGFKAFTKRQPLTFDINVA